MCIFGKRSQRAIIDFLCRMCVVCYNVNEIHSTCKQVRAIIDFLCRMKYTAWLP